jgi:hypothetical protein
MDNAPEILAELPPVLAAVAAPQKTGSAISSFQHVAVLFRARCDRGCEAQRATEQGSNSRSVTAPTG